MTIATFEFDTHDIFPFLENDLKLNIGQYFPPFFIHVS